MNGRKDEMGSAKGTILVVDDNPSNLSLLSSALEKHGYDVRPAISGALALRSLELTLPDLILLDIKMPEMDGYEVCSRLKADRQTRSVPVIFVSAVGETMDKVRAFDAGGVDYITKPFQFEEVLARVATHVALNRMRKLQEERNAELRNEISERRRVEAELRESEMRFRGIFDQTFQFCGLLKPDGAVLEANQTMLHFGGLSSSEVIGRPIWETRWWTISRESRKQLQSAVAKAARGELLRYEVDVLGAADNVATIDFSLKPVMDETCRTVLIILEGRDITERKLMEHVLRESERRLRFLSSRLLTIQEEERQGTAKEIHDRISQSLAAIKVHVECVSHSVGNEDIQGATKILELLIPMLQDIIRETRRIYMGLRPSTLDDLGIIATLQMSCRQLREIYQGLCIEETYEIQENDVPPELKIVIFRIAEEALHNAAKYSQAVSVRLSLAVESNAIELTVEDDGVGFDPGSVFSTVDHPKGFGLSSMRERAELAGGSFRIRSLSGQGATIRASWPCRGRNIVAGVNKARNHAKQESR